MNIRIPAHSAEGVRISIAALLSFLVVSYPTLSHSEQIISVPVRGADVQVAATLYRPQGNGPFPLIILSHGTPSTKAERAGYGYWRKPALIDALTSRGFAVTVPIRRGFGATGGKYVAGYGGCSSNSPDFHGAGLRAAEDIIATLEYMAELPFVDANKVVLMGQSAGGIASLAAASTRPPGIVAVANFSGGRGGRPKSHPGNPCHAEAMAGAIRKYASTVNVPVLWFYAANDSYFTPDTARMWFDAFTESGGQGKLVISPPFADDGHDILLSRYGTDIWRPVLDRFLRDQGL